MASSTAHCASYLFHYALNISAPHLQRTWRAYKRAGKGGVMGVNNADLIAEQLNHARLMEAALLQAAEDAWRMVGTLSSVAVSQ